MISTKKLNTEIMGLTPEERKKKVNKLKEEHEDYLQKRGNQNAMKIKNIVDSIVIIVFDRTFFVLISN